MFSEKIKNLQKRDNLTQEELAEIIGMTRTGLRGALANDEFKASAILKLAKHFCVPVSYFYSEEEGYLGHTTHAGGRQSVAVSGQGNLILNKNEREAHAPGGGEGSAISEKVNMLERLLEEKERIIEDKLRLIEQQERLLEEKERLIQILMKDKR